MRRTNLVTVPFSRLRALRSTQIRFLYGELAALRKWRTVHAHDKAAGLRMLEHMACGQSPLPPGPAVLLATIAVASATSIQ